MRACFAIAVLALLACAQGLRPGPADSPSPLELPSHEPHADIPNETARDRHSLHIQDIRPQERTP